MQQEFQEFADEKAAEENRAAESVTDADSTDENRAVFLISKIPAGARIVTRTYAEIDEKTGRAQYRDYVGHVVGHETAKKETAQSGSPGSETLILLRDAAANGSRKEQIVRIRAEDIVRIKPIPERKTAMLPRLKP